MNDPNPTRSSPKKKEGREEKTSSIFQIDALFRFKDYSNI